MRKIWNAVLVTALFCFNCAASDGPLDIYCFDCKFANDETAGVITVNFDFCHGNHQNDPYVAQNPMNPNFHLYLTHATTIDILVHEKNLSIWFRFHEKVVTATCSRAENVLINGEHIKKDNFLVAEKMGQSADIVHYSKNHWSIDKSKTYIGNKKTEFWKNRTVKIPTGGGKKKSVKG